MSATYSTYGGCLVPIARASIENPSFSLTDPALWDALGVPESSSGIRVSADTALTHSPWWRGVNLISGVVGKIPAYIYKRVANGKERAPEHPAYNLLRWKANPYQNAMVFKQQLTAHLLSYGNAYALPEYDGGELRHLWPLDPTMTYPMRDTETGRIWYVVEGESGPAARIDPGMILHLKGLGFDGLVGYNVVDYARDSIGLGLGQRKYCEVLYANGAQPRIVLEAPAAVTDKQIERVAKAWNGLHEGVDNFHRTAVLANGLKAHPLAFSNVDAQMVESRSIDIREMANWLGLPPHKLGDTTRTAFASLEQENQFCLDECYDYWFNVWEYELRDKLLSDDEKDNDTHVVEFMRQALVRADLKSRTESNSKATGGRAWKTPDEVRAEENYNTLGGDAAELVDPTNNFGGSDLPQEGPPEEGPPAGGDSEDDVATSARAVLADAERRALKRIGVHAVKAARDTRAFNDWTNALTTDHGPALRGILGPPAALAAAVKLIPDAGVHVNALMTRAQTELLELAGTVTNGAGLLAVIGKWAKDNGGE